MAKPLSGMRIVVCGKGGSGKSTLVTLMTRVLRDRGYRVHIVDGDASNPGLYWMLGFEEAPEPLIDFYGGKFFSGGKVTCPVDDPTPLERGEIGLDELPPEYFVEKEGLTFFRVGKIESVFEGCDGPESKVVRDFGVPGDHVTLIDLTAGLEHFARGIEINADGVVAVIDPTSTSLELARKAKDMVEGMKRGAEPAIVHLETAEDVEMARKLAKGAKVKYLWVILNKIRSEKIESLMRERLREYGIEPIGSIREDLKILESSLEGIPLRESGAREDVEKIVSLMESPLEVSNMKEPSIVIDVRGIEKPSERMRKVSEGLDEIEKGDYAEIVADDERMLDLAPKIIKSIGKAKFIRAWKGDDGYFHTLVEKM